MLQPAKCLSDDVRAFGAITLCLPPHLTMRDTHSVVRTPDQAAAAVINKIFRKTDLFSFLSRSIGWG